MDPLSMTASIIAILQLTSALTSYINDAKNATKEQAQLAIEASNLYGLLTALRFRVEEARYNDPWFNQVKLLGTENGPLDQFKDVLETIVKQLPSSRKRDQVKSILLWKLSKKEVENTLSRIERLKSLINCALTNDLTTLSKAIHDDVVAIKEQNEKLQSSTEAIHGGVIVAKEQIETLVDHGRPNMVTIGELRNGLSQWLGLPDPSPNYHAALRKRHPRTGLWLLNGQDFLDWKSSTSSLMWLHGNAGCGKTVLSSATLQHVLEHRQSQPDMIVSYFYFDFNDVEKQSWQKAIRLSLFQFALQCSGILEDLEKLYQNCGKGQQQPSEAAIQSLFREAVAHPGQKFIFLDALDECSDREDLLSFLVELMGSKPRDLHVLATSRREKDIEDELSSVANHNVNIQSALVDADICVYIHDRMATDKSLKKWPPSVQDEITTVLMDKAGGMRTLSSLPKTLDETYNRILQGLGSTNQLQTAIKALRWLCFSDRPLLLAEMVEIFAIENGDRRGFFPEERLPDPKDVMVICSSLITFNSIENEEGDNELQHSGIEGENSSQDRGEDGRKVRVQLAHFSVKEFLLSDRCAFRLEFRPQICHLVIAEGCLHYLLHLSQNGPLTEEVVKEYPLALYAAEYWWQHAQNLRGTLNDTLSDLVLRLLTDDTALLSWLQLYEIDIPWQGFQLHLWSNEIAQSLYYAAYIGVPQIVERMIERAVDVNAQGGLHGSALQAASFCGHEKVVKMLIDAGADVNAQGGEYGNALQAASVCGHEKVVKMLMDAGADINTQGGRHHNALHAASERGHEKVVKMLVDAGADVHAQGGFYGNSLQAASFHGDEKVAKMLMDAGADVNAQGGEYGNALQAASLCGHEKVMPERMSMLKEGNAGADVNAQGGEYGNALQAASVCGHEKVVKMLIDVGADVNAQGGFYGNSLQAASVHGHEKVVKILMDAGADVHTQGGYYGNALQAASVHGDEKVVKMLMDAGADVHTQGGAYSNALQAASVRGHEKVVKMLIDAGADVNAQGGAYANSLQAASAPGHEKVVKMLMDAGADVNAQGGFYGNSLQAASERGHEKVVKMLIDAGAVNWGDAVIFSSK
ncbi:uncharacterized protein Z518_06323 [Rhinocladiella mackenziei CBS 650.93]|uniref:Nephrocystin 3-like N-terminal domain-containing protein n=1 Tax=Rhinocladiella mackenziei CBS 650.93 TaxID=1442369 RepID=A0A0D2IQK1_9EURO|nr:uncharacterized protein Z518_06323 [Rhinocladiella mackenziei CBS 650.93]KIX05451.1 hypothetical protein Z518_06323 [Rhinocladiella mackenziei CBS 650.93]